MSLAPLGGLADRVSPSALDRLADLSNRIVYVPVRHHSPAAAQAVSDIIRAVAPAAVLVEGPSDFNPRLGELELPHQLPIAIYSHVRLEDGTRRGAYYPFCEYSPEWQALLTARACAAEARFIDVPYAAMAAEDERANLYSDTELRRSPYVEALCAQLGVDDFDSAWDDLFEIERLPPAVYLRRAHALCLALRASDREVSPSDRHREAFMAAEIRRAAGSATGRIVVVTGGYHSLALLDAEAPPAPGPPEAAPGPLPPERGLSLTPYSYERLDRLTGYEAGMPGPGFYHWVWRDRQRARELAHVEVIRDVARALRRRGQAISSADLIGVETTARALASLRGHGQVWRRDVIDGLTAAILKDEMARGGFHPLLEAIHEVLRGDERGRLAAGTTLPALVLDIRNQLEALDLVPQARTRDVELDLDQPGDRRRSMILHRLRVLHVAGFSRTDGTDLEARTDMAKVWERWRLVWSPEVDATSVEAARYGASMAEAAGQVLAEAAQSLERDSAAGARLLLDAALAGLGRQAAALGRRLIDLIRSDGDFARVSTALRHLLYLFRYDRVLGAPLDLQSLVVEAWQRGLWLLEGLAPTSGTVDSTLQGVALLVECQESAPDALPRSDLVDVLGRVVVDRHQPPAVRGAATGALWTLGTTGGDAALRGVTEFSDPARLGDFLVGLFSLARETSQREPELLRSIDRVLLGYDDDEFLEAVPALRLAFTYFTPREKHHLSLTLLRLAGLRPDQPPAPLAVDAEAATRALAFESRLLQIARRYGLRGAPR
jgi:hypothetical protein